MKRAAPPMDLEDLSVRARRDSLTEAERTLWEQAHASDTTLSTAHQVGVDFDRVMLVQPGDDQRVLRAAELTLARLRPQPLPRRAAFRRRWLVPLVAVLSIAGSALAWRGGAFQRLVDVSRRAQPSGAAKTAHVEHTAAAALPAVTAINSAVPSLVAALPSAQVAQSARSSTPLSAATLFREAAEARGGSDFGRARLLYLRLESEFPATAEARLAPVSLGKVLLIMGRASEAQQQFALYGRTGGPLAEEALVGQAHSFARLGRSADEQQIWQRLVHDFPRSVYASEARQRLSALGVEAQ